MAEAVPTRKKHQRSYQLPHGNKNQSPPHPGRGTAKIQRDKNYNFSSVNERACASIARSVARRSTLEASKNPAIPFVFSKIYCTSSVSARGPPWHSTITSSRLYWAPSCSSCIRPPHSSCLGAPSALTPIEPLTVVFICATSTSAPASVILTACSTSKTYGQVSISSSCA